MKRLLTYYNKKYLLGFNFQKLSYDNYLINQGFFKTNMILIEFMKNFPTTYIECLLIYSHMLADSTFFKKKIILEV